MRAHHTARSKKRWSRSTRGMKIRLGSNMNRRWRAGVRRGYCRHREGCKRNRRDGRDGRERRGNWKLRNEERVVATNNRRSGRNRSRASFSGGSIAGEYSWRRKRRVRMESGGRSNGDVRSSVFGVREGQMGRRKRRRGRKS